jgi:integrase
MVVLFDRRNGWYLGNLLAPVGVSQHLAQFYPHLFRHSDAIERLRQTGNPRALQLHLGHASPLMTMRYLSTLTAEEALRINQGVRFED